MPLKALILFRRLRLSPVKTPPILRMKTPLLRILILRNFHYRRNVLHLFPTNPRPRHTRTIKNRFYNIYNGEHRDHDWWSCVERHGFYRWHDKALEAYQAAYAKYTLDRTQILDWIATNAQTKEQAKQNFTNTDYAFKLYHQAHPNEQMVPPQGAQVLTFLSAKRAAEKG